MRRILSKREDITTILLTEENTELKRMRMEITSKKLENHWLLFNT